MTVDAETIGRRLQQARLIAGFSQAFVAERLGVPRPAISLIESGQRSVSGVEVAKLAELYGRTIGSFFGENGTSSEDNEEQIIEYYRAAIPARSINRARVARAITWFKEYARLEEDAFGEQRYDVPLYPAPRGNAVSQGEYLADQERHRLKLGTAPILSLIDLLEQQGVKVLRQRLSSASQVSGSYFFSAGLGPCVVINSSELPSRQRFTTAHEYAHFLIERATRPGDVCVTTRHREVAEMRANSFAAAFLLPAAGIEEFLTNRSIQRNQVDAEQVIHLMYHFRVSYRATLWRLFNLSWITVEQRRQLEAISPGALARVLGYADHELGATEHEPDRFRGVAIKAWRVGRLSLADLARHLQLPQQEVQIALTSAERAERAERPEPRAPRVLAEPDWF